MKELEDREYSGYSPSLLRLLSSPMLSPVDSIGLKDNRKLESPGITIGSYSPRSVESLPSPTSSQCFPEHMRNFQDQLQHPTMYGRMLLESPTRSLNLEPNPFVVTAQPTGKLFGLALNPAVLERYPPMLELSLTGPCVPLQLIMIALQQWKECVMFTGGPPVRVSQGGPGTKLVWMLTVKILDPSSGVDTKLTNLLSSMNFEEELISATCSAGWTVIRVEWNLKVLDVTNDWFQCALGS